MDVQPLAGGVLDRGAPGGGEGLLQGAARHGGGGTWQPAVRGGWDRGGGGGDGTGLRLWLLEGTLSPVHISSENFLKFPATGAGRSQRHPCSYYFAIPQALQEDRIILQT